MGILESTLQEITSFEEEFSRSIDKIDVITEYVESSYKIDTAQANLKFKEFEESGEYTSEQLYDDVTEITEKASERIQKALKSISASTKKYSKNLKSAVSKLVGDKDYDSLVKKCEDTIKEYPEIGKTKIEYKDYRKEESAISDGIDDISKLIAKIRSKKEVSESDAEKIKEIEDRVNKDRDKTKAVATTITVAAALALMITLIAAVNADTSKIADETPEEPTGFDPEGGRQMVRALGIKARLEKEKNATATRTIVSLYSSLKKAIKNHGNKTYKAKDIHSTFSEGVDDDCLELENYEEGADIMTLNADTTLGEIIDMVVNESAEDGSENFSDVYGKNLEEEIFGESTEFDTEEMEDEFDESAYEDDDFDVDAMLESCKEEAGLSTNTADDLLENFNEIFG